MKQQNETEEGNKSLNFIEEKILTKEGKEKIRKYIKGRFLGKGGFGKCYEFICEKSEKKFVGKIIDKSMGNAPLLINEIKIHKELHHRHIVSFEHYFEDKNNIYILLELCQNQTLKSLLERRKTLTELEVIYYITQLKGALKYLHNRKIIHRDLKLENLFIDKKMELKLGDFGLAIKLENNSDKIRTFCGTIYYCAPEILKKEAYSYEADIWALGIIIYKLIVGKFPFETKEEIKNKSVSFPQPDEISESAKDLIIQILEKDPNKRPSLEQILMHNFFKQAISIPENLPTLFLGGPPKPSYIKDYIPDVDIIKSFVIKRFEKIKLIDLTAQENETNNDKEGIHYIIKNEKNLKKSEICVKKWNDYSSKYGLGYLLTNGNYGVFFNDKSKIILNPKTNHFYFLKRNDKGEEEILSYYINDLNYSDEIKKNLIILDQFKERIDISNSINKEKKEKDIIESQKEEEKKVEKEEIINEEDEKPFIHIKKWKKSNHAVFFRLSNKVVQSYFKDDTQIIFDDEKTFTYVNKKGERLQYDRDLKSTDKGLIKKYNYHKNFMNHLLDEHLKKKALK